LSFAAADSTYRHGGKPLVDIMSGLEKLLNELLGGIVSDEPTEGAELLAIELDDGNVDCGRDEVGVPVSGAIVDGVVVNEDNGPVNDELAPDVRPEVRAGFGVVNDGADTLDVNMDDVPVMVIIEVGRLVIVGADEGIAKAGSHGPWIAGADGGVMIGRGVDWAVPG
jgi:hypothetical protein